jgi:hypothetical protein
MRLLVKITLVTCILALSAGPAALAHGKPEGSPPYGHGHGAGDAAHPNGKGNGPAYTPAEPTPGPKTGLPAKAKAYGRYCKGESKEHVKGEKGTAFSRCVNAMAKAASHEGLPPGRICKNESRKHVKGEKGTPFSRCVKAVAKLRNDQEEASA